MTTPDDNPFAPPSYPPPSGTPPAFPPPSGPAFVSTSFGGEVPPPIGPGLSSEAVTQPVAGALTDSMEAPPAPTNGSARRALLLASLTPVLTPVAGVAAVAIGRHSRKEIDKTGERGAGLAKAAIWTGAALSILWVLGVAFLIALKIGSIAS